MITVKQNLVAIAPNIQTFFGQTGAVEPFTFSVLPGGAGGSITSEGLYTAPQISDYNPKKFIDTIQVQDVNGDKGTAKIMVLPVIGLIANIIQVEMGLEQDQVSLYQQKFNVPNDNKVHIAVGMLTQKPYATKREYKDIGSGLNEIVFTSWKCIAWVEIYSSSNLAFLRKEEIASALYSTYSEQIQDANNFKIAKMPSQFTNISSEQGPGIPYRFNISVSLLYTTSKEKPVPYFTNFENASINVDD